MKQFLSKLVLVGFISCPGTAFAQAFTQSAGDTRLIATTIYSDSNKGFDNDGNVEDIADYGNFQIYLNLDYGLTDDLTVLFAPSFRSVTVEDDSDTTGLGYTEAGARYRLVDSHPVTLSLQGTIRVPGETRQESIAQIGNTDVEYDFRAQGGLSFDVGDQPSFAIIETGYRLREDEPPNEFRIDATVGIRAAPRLLLIANSFNTISDGAGFGVFDEEYNYHNIFLSAAYEISPNVTIQAGGLATIAGKNALRERGFFASIWSQF